MPIQIGMVRLLIQANRYSLGEETSLIARSMMGTHYAFMSPLLDFVFQDIQKADADNLSEWEFFKLIGLLEEQAIYLYRRFPVHCKLHPDRLKLADTAPFNVEESNRPDQRLRWYSTAIDQLITYIGKKVITDASFMRALSEEAFSMQNVLLSFRHHGERESVYLEVARQLEVSYNKVRPVMVKLFSSARQSHEEALKYLAAIQQVFQILAPNLKPMLDEKAEQLKLSTIAEDRKERIQATARYNQITQRLSDSIAVANYQVPHFVNLYLPAQEMKLKLLSLKKNLLADAMAKLEALHRIINRLQEPIGNMSDIALASYNQVVNRHYNDARTRRVIASLLIQLKILPIITCDGSGIAFERNEQDERLAVIKDIKNRYNLLLKRVFEELNVDLKASVACREMTYRILSTLMMQGARTKTGIFQLLPIEVRKLILCHVRGTQDIASIVIRDHIRVINAPVAASTPEAVKYKQTLLVFLADRLQECKLPSAASDLALRERYWTYKFHQQCVLHSTDEAPLMKQQESIRKTYLSYTPWHATLFGKPAPLKALDSLQPSSSIQKRN